MKSFLCIAALAFLAYASAEDALRTERGIGGIGIGYPGVGYPGAVGIGYPGAVGLAAVPAVAGVGILSRHGRSLVGADGYRGGVGIDAGYGGVVGPYGGGVVGPFGAGFVGPVGPIGAGIHSRHGRSLVGIGAPIVPVGYGIGVGVPGYVHG